MNGTFSMMNGKIIATLYEAYIMTKEGKMYTPSIMNEPMSLREIIKHWQLKKDDVEWCVAYGVDMVRREAKTAQEKRIGCGFRYLYFEIFRNGNVPADFDVRKYHKYADEDVQVH